MAYIGLYFGCGRPLNFVLVIYRVIKFKFQIVSLLAGWLSYLIKDCFYDLSCIAATFQLSLAISTDSFAYYFSIFELSLQSLFYRLSRRNNYDRPCASGHCST